LLPVLSPVLLRLQYFSQLSLVHFGGIFEMPLLLLRGESKYVR
jgi:hypothetical protein